MPGTQREQANAHRSGKTKRGKHGKLSLIASVIDE
jgi:hypothetical protein